MVSADSAGLVSARLHRKALAAALQNWVGRSVSDLFADGKQYFEGAFIAEGEGVGAELTLDDDSRHQPWVLDLEREAKRLAVCESGATLVYDVARSAWKPRTLGCSSKLCPVCARVRAAKACGRWRAILDAASADGAVLRHWTLTQPALSEPGGLITAGEAARGWTGTLASDGVRARAVGGEGLGKAYIRLRTSLTNVRDGRRTRARWKRGLGAHLVGIEWTGRGRGGTPRYHAHAHIIACTEAGTDVEVHDMLLDWVAETGGAVKAQHVRIVDSSAITEVLKYPFKPAHLTQAQRIEALAYMRGMRPQHPSGAWSGNSRASREAPWAGWLAAREEQTEYLRLHVIPDSDTFEEGTHRPQLWTGAPSEGHATWAVRRGGHWRTWRADAAPYAARLSETPCAPLPPIEAGADVSEQWFDEP